MDNFTFSAFTEETENQIERRRERNEGGKEGHSNTHSETTSTGAGRSTKLSNCFVRSTTWSDTRGFVVPGCNTGFA
jgi:hypothetical protein